MGGLLDGKWNYRLRKVYIHVYNPPVMKLLSRGRRGTELPSVGVKHQEEEEEE